MQLGIAFDCVASEPQPEFFTQFAQDLPVAWIEEALSATGTASLRRRRLPAEEVVWLVIGMALMRDLGLKTNRLHRVCSNLEEVVEYFDDLGRRRDALDYEIDGVVVKVDRLDLREPVR